ncbi:hypothetical protein [Streptosporangium vulgare]|uniref:hypothetical protein n=1 Tax=Streptosporangium vulgare TaxID=46190 RepID=UPI0031DED31D
MATPDDLRRVRPAARACRSTGRCRPSPGGGATAPLGRGIGVLLVERLSDARRNGHQIPRGRARAARSTRTVRATA